jgi:hypothetical protein
MWVPQKQVASVPHIIEAFLEEDTEFLRRPESLPHE